MDDGRAGSAHRALEGIARDAAVDGARTLTDRICERLRAVHAYGLSDLDDIRPEGMKTRDWKLAVHAAEDVLLHEGIVFSPLNGLRRRATTALQVVRREGRFARSALRKMERTVKLAAAAAPLASSDEDRRRIENRELKRQNAIVNARAALRGAATARPKGI